MALCLTVAVLAIALGILAAAALIGLLKGCSELRRSLRAASQGFDSVLLKSPIVPGVSVILAPRTRRPNRARWCGGCWTCTSAGTNSCWCWTGPT